MDKSIYAIILALSIGALLFILLFKKSSNESYKLKGVEIPEEEVESFGYEYPDTNNCCGCSGRVDSDLSADCRSGATSCGRYPIDLPAPEEPRVPAVCNDSNLAKFLIQ